MHIGPTLAEQKDDLERLGWTVELVDGARPDFGTEASIVVPLVRALLGRV